MSKLQKAQAALKAQGYDETAANVLSEASVNARQRWFQNGETFLFVDPNTFAAYEVDRGAVPQGSLYNITAAMQPVTPEPAPVVETTESAAVESESPATETPTDAQLLESKDLDTFTSQVRRVFYELYPGSAGAPSEVWVRTVMDDSVIVDMKGALYQVAYKVKGDKVSFAAFPEWVKVVHKEEYVPAKESVTEAAMPAECDDPEDTEDPAAKKKKKKGEVSPDEPNADKPKESTRTLYLSELTPLTEAVVDSDAKTVEVTLIKPGWSANGKYYGADVLKRDMGIFEGVKAYADHPSKNDETNRPERSVKDITGYYTNVRQADDGSLKATRHFVGSVGTETIFPLVVEAITNKPDLMGLSINALGKTKLGEVDGRKGVIVEALVKGNSVDDVTTPAAGGKYDRLLMAGDEFTTDLLQALEYDEWRESRPDFVARLKTEMRTARKEELTEAAIQEAAILREQVTVLETTNRELAEAKATSDAALSDLRATQARREGELVVERKLAESRLPDAWKETIKPHLAGKTAAEIDTVLEAEWRKFFSFKQPVAVRESGAEGVNADTVITREQAVVTSALGVDPSEAVLEGESPEQWARRLGKLKS